MNLQIPQIDEVKRQEHLDNLYQLNLELLLPILGTTFLQELKQRTATIDACNEAQLQVENILFQVPADISVGGDLAIMMRSNPKEFRRLTDSIVAQEIQAPTDQTITAYESGFSPLLVRPELYYLHDQVEALLLHHGLEVLSIGNIRVSFHDYWILYHHVFGMRRKEGFVRRRALGYIDRTCFLFLVRREGYDALKTSEFLVRHVKGDAGFGRHLTLRGDIIFREVSYLIERLSLETLFALDPLMQFERDGINAYDQGVASLFHANLQGVHVSEPHEVLKDLCVLLPDNWSFQR